MRYIALCFLLAACGSDPGPGEPVGGDPGASGKRLKLQFLEGSDGSRLPQGFWDSERNEACEPMVDEAGAPRCLPKSSAVSTERSGGNGAVFADSSCTQVVVAVGSNCLTNPRYVLEAVNEGGVACGGPTPTWRVNLIKAKVIPPFYRDGEGKCVSGIGLFGVAYVVEPIPPSAFVALTRKAL